MASGFPDRVPAWYTGPSGASWSMSAARPADRGEREPAAETLPNIDRSGVMPTRPCAPAGPSAEAGDHLVEDEQRARARCSGARSPARKPSAGRDEAHVGGDRLDEHRGEVGAVAVERRVERGVVVVGDDDGVGDRARR